MMLSFVLEEKLVLFVVFVHFVFTVQKGLGEKYDLVDHYSVFYFVDLCSIVVDFD